MNNIYLDNSATTKVDKKVFEAMKPYFEFDFGNPSSIHSTGQSARTAVDSSRKTIAEFLNCESSEIVFTSGGSESDNLAIKGIIDSVMNQISNLKSQNDISKLKSSQKKNPQPTTHNLSPPLAGSRQNAGQPNLPHVITSSFEHHAVLDTVKELEKEGKVEATYVDPNKEGIISVKDIEIAIKNNTVLVSIMYVNNEIGTVQPIREIGKMIERINHNRKDESRNSYNENSISNSELRAPNFQNILFHTDAVQATSYFEMNTKYLHVDLLTISAHKVYGPKGIGALFVKKGTKIKHQIVGGGQEFKVRAGTENVPAIVGFAKAIKLIQKSKIKNQNDNSKIKKLRDKLIDGLLKIDKTTLNGSRVSRSPNNVNISFENAEGESILINLDMEGIAASSGSACTSGSLEPSHVLTAIGVPAEKSHGSIRLTLSKDTTKEEVDKVIEVMPKIIGKLRAMSPIR